MFYAGGDAMRVFQIVFSCCLPFLCRTEDGYFKTFQIHVRNKYMGISLVERTNCIIDLSRHSSQGEGSDQYSWPVRMDWAGIRQDKFKRLRERVLLEQPQLIGSDLREENM